jgi:hypothetical protein
MIALAALFGACAKHAERPQDASGDTPVKFVNCDGTGRECFVTARFDDLDSCERYDRFSSAYCDSVSMPGKIICDTTRASAMSKGYCIAE